MLRNSNRLLQKNLAEINKQYARSLCEKFSALPKLEHPYHQKQQSTVANLSKQSSELMTNLFDSLGSIKVEKLSKKSHSNENKKNTINILMVKTTFYTRHYFIYFILTVNNKNRLRAKYRASKVHYRLWNSTTRVARRKSLSPKSASHEFRVQQPRLVEPSIWV